MEQLKESAQKVQLTLIKLGYCNQVVELPDSTRTAQDHEQNMRRRTIVCRQQNHSIWGSEFT
ncbi:hypothetical protein [Brevibacillus reuszeri]|uniref:hypothetical protein n=1 Tax=Brevibacillus reuszeri TaxID=54915 RepID=UPI000CCC5C06|nr:hypothetical protein [Brevibacillus reuszeri]